MFNKEIRQAAKSKGVMLWQLAEALGIQDSGLSRKLRHELPDEEKEVMLRAIDSIVAERQAG